jgi:hypothetical protein
MGSTHQALEQEASLQQTQDKQGSQLQRLAGTALATQQSVKGSSMIAQILGTPSRTRYGSMYKIEIKKHA